MKIALVVHDLHEQGGHSLYTKILADELSRRHEVEVFANRSERPSESRWKSRHVRAWRLNALACVQTFPLGVRAFASELDSFEIRHMQGYCGGRPNVVTAHICVAAYLDSLRAISAQNRVSLGLMSTLEGRFYRRYDGHVIAISEKIARELREFYQLRGKISVIPHGVDASRFSALQRARYRSAVRRTLGINQETTVLYIGDLTKAHVHLKALAAAAPQVQFIIVSGSMRYFWNMPNVRFLSPTTSIERYYAAADAFVFPTTYDAFGMVVLEAMASGLPVFTSDCAGAAELIRSGEDGFVVGLDEWVEHTRVGLLDREHMRQVGHNAEEKARRHDWTTVVQRVEQVYKETIAAERTTETVACGDVRAAFDGEIKMQSEASG